MWVLAESVWRKEKVVRQVTVHELLSMWDYEGKWESRRWSAKAMGWIVTSRLKSPPANILRAVAFPEFEHALRKFYRPTPYLAQPGWGAVGVGTTAQSPYSPLERKEDIGQAAAREDHAVVDLSVWAPPGETAEVAAAQERIRKRAVAWWVFKVEQDGHQWLRDHPKYAERDVIAIEDSICRAKACSYWEWHRGSRIMWFRLPSEWQALFWDGP